jgi:RNA polymerase sigma factor (sigma-70 family)
MSTDTRADIEKLLERHRAGDPAARQELLSRAYDRLVRIAHAMFHKDFRRLVGRHDLESVVNEAWISLMRSLESTRPSTNEEFFGLVFLKVRQTLLQIARRDQRHDGRRVEGTLDPDEPEAMEAFDRADTTNEPGRLAILTELHKQIELLPGDERTVFELRYYLGYSQAEIAEILDLHPRKVSRLWQGATARLAEWLGGFHDAF